MENIILTTDSYKVSHWKQYPEGTTNIYSYFESRGGEFKKTVFFGLQYLLKKYLEKPVTIGDVVEAREFYKLHFGRDDLFNFNDWFYIANELGGRLPVRIRAVPEGTVVDVSNVLMTIENTDPRVPWITNWLETLLSQVWYPTTVATVSYAAKQLIYNSAIKTGDTSLVDFKLHDFGFRGVSSVESAEIGGLAHLVNFKGSDTVAGIWAAKKYYEEEMAGFGIPAAEHSAITSWGRENEVEAFRNMVKQFGDYPFYAVVSDSYDIYKAAKDLWGKELKSEVLEAEGTLVVRPDSGYPPIVVLNLLKILGDSYGVKVNGKGYKVLNPKVRIIQGDGLNLEMIEKIIINMETNGWSIDNVSFGMGAGLLQRVNRDTQKFAFKASDITINGEHRDVYKDPVTDAGKVSKKGRFSLILNGNGYYTTREDLTNDHLTNVYEDGILLSTSTLEEVRRRAWQT